LSARWDYECNLSSNCRVSLIQFAYDVYGNALSTWEYGDYALSGDERYTLRGYQPNTSAYIVGLPSYENVYDGLNTGAPLMQRVMYYYDGSTATAAPTKGDLTRIRKWNSETGAYIKTDMTYDAWGNLVSETDPRGFTATTAYDATYRIYPIRATNALNQSSNRTWDYTLGLETVHTDPNGAATRTAYDAFGRRVSLTYPDGSVSTFQYVSWSSPTAKRIREVKPDGTGNGLFTDIYQDGLGRVYKVVQEGGVAAEIQYTGATERVFKKSLPYRSGETVQWIVYSYDGAKRLRATTFPDGSVAEIQYANDASGKPYEAHYDELDNQRLFWMDPYGNLIKVREKNGASYYYTSYEYDALDRLRRTVDARNKVIALTYDSLGRKLSSSDPDMGLWTYAYDAGGLMTAQTDAKGQTLTFQYDALGRMTRKTYPGGASVQWRYDESGHGAGKGRLTSVTHPAGSESYDWDVRGLKTEETRCVEGVCETVGFAYDALGRLAEVVYPDGERVAYGYNGEGQLNTVSGYVTGMSWSAAGRLTSMTYANGTTNTFAYDAKRQWLTSATVKRGTTTLFQAGYSYDAAARMTATSSTTNPLYNLTYGYDNLDRLMSVGGAQTQTFAYDATGNMTSN